MKTRYWKVGIEIYEDGRVLSAVLWSREATYQPSASYRKEPGREVFSFWYETKAAAHYAVLEAMAMNKKQGAVA
ncbi:MAG: hypothetical protein LBJ41_05830 [Treponema sp.]|jgi:hypothetical protein|nr:hypothetical protein [Treponema sp.]